MSSRARATPLSFTEYEGIWASCLKRPERSHDGAELPVLPTMEAKLHLSDDSEDRGTPALESKAEDDPGGADRGSSGARRGRRGGVVAAVPKLGRWGTLRCPARSSGHRPSSG